MGSHDDIVGLERFGLHHDLLCRKALDLEGLRGDLALLQIVAPLGQQLRGRFLGGLDQGNHVLDHAPIFSHKYWRLNNV